MKHVISALVQNQPGVLAHVAGMFAARGFNIDSLVVGRTEDASMSRMTIVVVGDDSTVEQVRKQLGKLIHIVRVRDYQKVDYVERDLMLVRVTVDAEHRQEVVDLAGLFRGKVVDVAADSVVVELAGPEDKLEGFIEQARPYGIRELARTGVIALERGKSADAGKNAKAK